VVALGFPAGATEWISANRDVLFPVVFGVFFLGGLTAFAFDVIKGGRGFVTALGLVFRRPGSRAFQRERGWNLVPGGTITWTRPLALQPLSGARDLTVTDFASGMSDGVVCAAFLGYPPGEQMLAIELADLPRPLPPLRLYPTVFDNIATTRSTEPAFVSESVDFNAKWTVRARDARYASAILTPRFMERLLRDDASDMTLIIDGGALITMTFDAIVPNDRIAAHLAVLRDLISLITPATFSDFATGEPGNSWRWVAAGAPRGTWRFFGRSGSFG
jgi:hypothetical protein